MNPATNVNGQHEMHPDVETLSAFTELALNAKQRDEVLAHLAVCGRCRQVVALTRDAAGTEVAAARHEATRPRVWWRSWGLALVPAAALAATVAIAVNIHERAVERTAEVAKLELQQANEKAAMPSQALPEPRTDAVQPTPATPVDVPARPRETERPDETRRKPPAERDETAAAAPPPETRE
ncbi:MAG: zf-HC2 domain-containing protein [Terracidiphilus sp.]